MRDEERAELYALRRLFDLQNALMWDVIKMWRAESPVERERQHPSLNQILTWLLGRIRRSGKAERQRCAQIAEQEERRLCEANGLPFDLPTSIARKLLELPDVE